MEIQTNVRYEVQMPDGEISEAGITEITLFRQAQRLNEGEWIALNPTSTLAYLPSLPYDWEWVWSVARGEYRGTFPKRIAQYYFKQYRIKCPVAFLASIGNLARRHSAEPENHSIDFVDSFDWESGDFGDYGSCYWGDHAGARTMLEENGGLAIRFFENANSDDGKARAWLVPLSVGTESTIYYLFNGYGFTGDATLKIAKIFAHFTHLEYKNIPLHNHRESSGVLYINGGHGYVIGTSEQIAPITAHDFRFAELYICERCGRGIDPENAYYGPDDEMYCEYCYSDLFTTCDRCGHVEYYENATDVETIYGFTYICENCLDNQYTICAECGVYTPNYQVLEQHLNPLTGEFLCANCRAPE